MVADFPVDMELLRSELNRSKDFRDESLHLSKYTDQGRGGSVHWHRGIDWTREPPAGPPIFIFTSSVNDGSGTFPRRQIMKPEIEAVLDKLDPWLKSHNEKRIDAERAALPDGWTTTEDADVDAGGDQ